MGEVGRILLECLKDDKFVDLSIICSDKTVQAHRVVLAAQSDFFAEHDEREIDMSEHSSDAVFAMIHWFYAEYYPPCRSMSDAMLHFRIHKLATDLDIDGLTVSAKMNFRATLRRLIDGSVGSAKEMTAMVHQAYHATKPDSALRVALLTELGDAHCTIFDEDNQSCKPLRYMIAKKLPGLGLEILACMAKGKKTVRPQWVTDRSMRFTRPSYHDDLGDDSIDKDDVRAISEPGDSESATTKDCSTPPSTTLSVAGSDVSAVSWTGIRQVSEKTIRSDAGAELKKPQAMRFGITVLSKARKAHKHCSCDEDDLSASALAGSGRAGLGEW